MQNRVKAEFVENNKCIAIILPTNKGTIQNLDSTVCFLNIEETQKLLVELNRELVKAIKAEEKKSRK